MRIYLVDDDYAILTMLENIIVDYDLGSVIGKALEGDVAIDEILALDPDIVVVDFLLPKIDGVELVKKIKERREKIQFIMLSQVTSKEMIGDAYHSGIESFINKPINVMEVKTVIQKATEKIRLKQIINRIHETSKSENQLHENLEIQREDVALARKILVDLGISNDSGGRDILHIVEMIVEYRKDAGRRYHRYNIGDMYEQLHKIYKREGYKGSSNIRAIEQRIRRTIQQGMDNVSMLGIEDFGNYKFEKYSSRLFDFSEVKRNMDYIRGKSNYRGKISVKTFIEGLINMMEE
jgi:two-component system response regulator YcbB